jgi:hypothetical protein
MSSIFRHTPHPALVPRDSDSIVPLVFAEIADQCSSALCRGYPPPWHSGASDLCKLKDADSLRNPKSHVWLGHWILGNNGVDICSHTLTNVHVEKPICLHEKVKQNFEVSSLTWVSRRGYCKPTKKHDNSCISCLGRFPMSHNVA